MKSAELGETDRKLKKEGAPIKPRFQVLLNQYEKGKEREKTELGFGCVECHVLLELSRWQCQMLRRDVGQRVDLGIIGIK